MKNLLFISFLFFIFSCRNNKDKNTNVKDDTIGVYFTVHFDEDTVSILYKDSIIYNQIVSTSYTIGIASYSEITDFKIIDSCSFSVVVNNKKKKLIFSEKDKYCFIYQDTNNVINYELDSVIGRID